MTKKKKVTLVSLGLNIRDLFDWDEIESLVEDRMNKDEHAKQVSRSPAANDNDE